MAENFLLLEFTAAGITDIVCRRENTAEVKFVFEHEGYLLPVEVKSGGVPNAKSLKVFADKYRTPVHVILGSGFLRDREHGVVRVPLYLGGRLNPDFFTIRS